jgi:predicted glycosyltransferase involved in capsule biosynthesis
MKHDLSDCTFLIPLMIDTKDRERNLQIVIDYLMKYFNTKVIIAEQGKEKVSPINEYLAKKYNEVSVVFCKSEADYFHKNKLLNTMIKRSVTPYVVSYDSDVIFSVSQYVNSANVLRKNIAQFCFPFDRPMHRVLGRGIGLLKQTLNISQVEPICPQHHHLTPPGGCLFMNKQSLKECGYENENFKSWGQEDMERIERITKLGYKLVRVNGKLFHIEHARTVNSIEDNPHRVNNEEEYNKVVKMTKDELQKYVKTWSWIK